MMNENLFIKKGDAMPKSKERCQQIRDEMRSRILEKSLLFFACNGFAGTKISDLSKHIGIAQGTIYRYFESKEELFNEVYKIVDNKHNVKEIKLLSGIPISAETKIKRMSSRVLEQIQSNIQFAACVALNTQMMLEEGKEPSSMDTTYKSELYLLSSKIFQQGQKEGSVVDGSVMKLVDYYWGVVYLYALKRLFTSSYEMITTEDLTRVVLRGK